MAREITVSSTTDTQEAVDAAASYGLKTASAVEQPNEVETEQPSVALEEDAEIAARRESDTEEPEEEEETEGEPPAKGGEEEEEPEGAAQAEQRVGKSRRKLLRRLSRMHGEKLTLEEKVQQLETRLRGFEAKPPTTAETVPGLVKPQSSQFKNDDDYAEALADYKIAVRDQAAAQKAQEEYVKQVSADYDRQVSKAREAYDDFDQAVGTEAPVPDIAIQIMKHELENGADVAYYLAKHPETQAELLEYNQQGYRGGATRIAAKLLQISESLSSKNPSRNNTGAPKARPSTSAPAPIRPVGATARSSVDMGEMQYQDFKRQRNLTKTIR